MAKNKKSKPIDINAQDDNLAYIYEIYRDNEVLRESADSEDELKKKYPDASRIVNTYEIEPKF